MRLLARVNHLMELQIVRVGKGSRANIALVGTLLGVNSGVDSYFVRFI